MILRIVWVLCFCGACVAAFSWWEIHHKMAPLSKVVDLQPNNLVTESFIPTMEDDTEYQVVLAFEQTPTFSLNCNDLRSLDIRWAVLENQAMTSNRPSGSLSTQDYSCRTDENITVARFPPFQLKPSAKHYLHLVTKSRDQLQVRASVFHAGGITLHYLFMDKAALEILGGFALLVGFFCFLADFLLTLFRWRSES